MKKYDLSKIMKRAWEYVKKFKMTISSGLKRAWMEAKNGLKGSPKQIAWANDIRNRAIDVLKLNIDPKRFKSALTLLGTSIEELKEMDHSDTPEIDEL